MLAREMQAPLYSHRTPGGNQVSVDADLLIDAILDGQHSAGPLVAEIVNLDDGTVRTVEKPIGVDNHAYRRRAGKRAYENLLFQRAAEKQIGRMPDEGETIHMVVSAAYRTVDLIPAWLALKAPVPIAKFTSLRFPSIANVST